MADQNCGQPSSVGLLLGGGITAHTTHEFWFSTIVVGSCLKYAVDAG